MDSHWNWGPAFTRLREDINVLAWVVAEQRVLMDTMWILQAGITVDDALKLLHNPPAPCPSGAEHEPAEAGALE